MKEQIYKVQISLGDEKQMLIYNKKQDEIFEGEAPKEIIDLMNGEPKKYLYGYLKGTLINFTGDEAPWQDW